MCIFQDEAVAINGPLAYNIIVQRKDKPARSCLVSVNAQWKHKDGSRGRGVTAYVVLQSGIVLYPARSTYLILHYVGDFEFSAGDGIVDVRWVTNGYKKAEELPFRYKAAKAIDD
jgi:hypothetical protein